MKFYALFLLFLGIACYTENEKICWDYFKLSKMTDEGIAGLMGNLYAESRMIAAMYDSSKHSVIGLTNKEYVKQTLSGQYKNFVNDNVGFGIAQWSFWTRKQALLNMCGDRLGQLVCQLDYLATELQTGYSKILRTLQTSHDIYTCTVRVMAEFIGAKDQSTSAKNLRTSYSRRIYKELAGLPPLSFLSLGNRASKTYIVQPEN